MAEPDLSPASDHEWRNWHATEGVGGKVERFFTPRNLWADGTKPARMFEAGAAALAAIVRIAEKNGKRVRAIGSGWSLNSCAFNAEYLVNTARLNEWFIGFNTESMLTESFRPRKRRMVFAQCGVQLKVLNGYLEARRLSLPTSGASNGQTIVGALSTGTHGAAHAVGAIQDFMLALHVVGRGGGQYLIQRASRRAVTQKFAAWLGAKLVEDDALFNAAVVSFGSFGLIHGVLFEAEPAFLLERRVYQLDYPAVVIPATTLDVSSLGLPRGPELPFHFEVVLNPYRLGYGEQGAFVRFMYKRLLGPTEAIPKPELPPSGLQPSEDLVGIAGTVADVVPAAIPSLLQSQLVSAMEPIGAAAVRTGTHGQIFGDTLKTNGGSSIEIGVPLERVAEAMGLILGVCQAMPFGAPLALRYVRSSPASLAFTRFGKVTCAMEMPGIDSQRTRDAFAEIARRFAASDIPHSYHWGQVLPLEPEWVKRAFGPRRDAWLAARRRFLGAEGCVTFGNALLSSVGLG
jgi:hypothetical protein